jgi:dihydroorotate dehydrogenase
MNFFSIIKPFINIFPAEFSHNMAIFLLKNRIFINPAPYQNNILTSNLASLQFANPVGLAAGFDKNAYAFHNLAKFHFSFMELGTVTPKAQKGNPKPRLFRFNNEQAIINRMGFNNKGKVSFYDNLHKNHHKVTCPVGVNLGKNKHSIANNDDYLELLEFFYQIADYLTINISSPNTPNLRDIQQKDLLESLLKAISIKKKTLQKKHIKNTPIFLKIAPDLKDSSLQDICDLALRYKIDALIISNSTVNRDNVSSKEVGGMSGVPLFELSNKILQEAFLYSKGKISLIGCGGISNAQDAYLKICLGASLLQIYSAFIFQGFGLVNKINQDLANLLIQDGYSNIKQAVGSKA